MLETLASILPVRLRSRCLKGLACLQTCAYNDHLPQKNALLLKLTAWIPFLKTLGAWGVAALAAIDSAAIPIPLDALVAGYVYSNPGHAWLYAIAGPVCSALGSLVPYYLGRAGGQLYLLQRIDAAVARRTPHPSSPPHSFTP